MSNACLYRKEIYNKTGITAADTGSVFVTIPKEVGNFYFKITATEVAAGGITVGISGNESASTTDGVVIHSTGALSATGVTRVRDRAVSGTVLADATDNESLLPPYLYTLLSSVTGTWDILIELYYSKTVG